MNSLTLKEMGFSEPCPLKSVSFSSLPMDKSVVFAVIDTALTGKAPSDILYIGRSKKPTKRIFGGYLGGYGGKNTQKINSSLFEGGYIEKTSISWMLSDKPKTAQRDLLNKFGEEQGEFPMWNASKKKPVKAKAKSKSTPVTKQKTSATSTARTQRPRRASKKDKSVKPAAPAKPATPIKPAETSSITAASSGNTNSSPKAPQ